MSERLEIVNFKKTLVQLQSFLQKPIQDDRDRAGVIQGFEFTFEQAWKSIQKLAGKQGVNIASPKQAFTFAMQNGWINKADEALWLKMIEDQNLTTHTYKEDLAKEVLSRISGTYVRLFTDLLSAIE